MATYERNSDTIVNAAPGGDTVRTAIVTRLSAAVDDIYDELNTIDAEIADFTSATDLAESGGSALVGFLQDGTGAVDRTAQDKMRDFVSVKDFGAVGDGETDDTEAIRAAIRAVVAGSALTGDSDPTGMLFFPAGVYRITESGLFSDYDETRRYGLLCFGAGPGNSVIWLDPSALSADAWFYDNGAIQTATGASFRDMGFSGGTSRDASLTYSNFDSKCNGFKMSGPGYESSFSFFNCIFYWLSTVVQISGSNNADTQIFTDCEFKKCKDIVVLDNPQAFNVQLESCYASLMWGDVARWTANAAGGAGNFRINGGAYIMIPDDWGGGTCSIINCATAGPSAGNGCVGVRDARFELRGNGSAIGNFTNGNPVFLFENCSFLKNSATAPTTWATTNIYKTVTFRDCSFSPTSGQWPVLVISGASRYGKNGTFLFENCYLPGWDDWTLTFTNNYGSVITRNCFSSYADPSGEPGVREVNGEVRGNEGASSTSRARQILTVHPLKGTSLPIGNGTNESTIALPRGAMLLRVRFYLPAAAAGATANTWRLRVGSNDKSVIYAETSAAAQNAGFTLDAAVYVRLGTALADRTVRVWADNGDGGSVTAGAPAVTYASLEYV